MPRPAAFTLKLGDDDKHVSVEALKEALESALEMLQCVGEDFTPVKVRWEVVKASMRSPLSMTFAPRVEGANGRGIGLKIVRATLQGVKQVEERAVLPAHFNEEALLAAKKLHQVANGEGAKVTLTGTDRERVTLTLKTPEHIKEIVEKARVYLDFGTLEGTLEILSVHGHPSFSIFEHFTGYKVECAGTPERFHQARSLLGQRVAVTGRIKYRNHKPKTIQVEEIRVLRSASELPQPPNMAAIDITGGLGSEEHVRRLRNAR